MKWLKRIALVTLLLLGLGFGLGSIDRCSQWLSMPVGLVGLSRATGALQVGAAKRALELPYPVAMGGYGPWRSEVSSAVSPLNARATVVQVGSERLALVSLEAVLISNALVTAIRDGRTFHVWVVATHTHTGPGNYDPRLAVELGALGRYRPEVEAALVSAARGALDDALAKLAPAAMDVSTGSQALTRARASGEVDSALTRIRFRTPGGSAVAQWLLVAAHPTLAPRFGTQLDADYPGLLAQRFENEGGAGVTSVLQTAGGNAMAMGALPEFTLALGDAFAALPDGATEADVGYGLATADFALGHPDGSRLGPALVGPIVENALCAQAMSHAEVGVLRLGSISFAAVPAEVTQASAKVILQQSKSTFVLSLANGYQGYVEPEDVVNRNEGEAHRQYFGAGLLSQFAEAARQAGQAAGTFGAK